MFSLFQQRQQMAVATLEASGTPAKQQLAFYLMGYGGSKRMGIRILKVSPVRRHPLDT